MVTKLFYRGVAYEAAPKRAQTLTEQMRRKELTYRGVEHDGEKAIETTVAREVPMFYRGHRFA